jgi:hypothetical protein
VTQDWLLVETLGEQPVVVAQGRQIKNFVPIAVFLRRNPNLAAIQTAIAETITNGHGLASITPKTNRVIRTEPITMSDGSIHAVHLWCGSSDDEPPVRPIPGPLKWDFTLGEATGTVEYLTNAGMDPATEKTTGRSFVEDIPSRSLNRDEATVLARALDPEPGQTYYATWEFTDKQGQCRRVGFVSRLLLETTEDGDEHLIARAMNLVEEVLESAPSSEHLAERILGGLAEPGVYRLLIDLKNWTLLKWLDEPCPYFNWRAHGEMHPDDRKHYAETMTAELENGSTSAVLRLPGEDGDWVPLHVTISRVELDENIYAGMVSLRRATEAELAGADLQEYLQEARGSGA